MIEYQLYHMFKKRCPIFKEEYIMTIWQDFLQLIVSMLFICVGVYFSYFCTSGWSNAVEIGSELKTIRIKCSKVISFLINFTVIFASESNQD